MDQSLISAHNELVVCRLIIFGIPASVKCQVQSQVTSPGSTNHSQKDFLSNLVKSNALLKAGTQSTKLNRKLNITY